MAQPHVNSLIFFEHYCISTKKNKYCFIKCNYLITVKLSKLNLLIMLCLCIIHYSYNKLNLLIMLCLCIIHYSYN